MKPLIYPKKERTTGIYAYCQKCKTCIGSGKCQRTKKRIQSCEFPDFHTYRASLVVPNTGGTKRKNKILNTTDLQEAIRLKFTFEQEIKGLTYQSPTMVQNISQVEHSPYLIECMDMFIRYLNNEGVEIHKQKMRSVKHINDVKRYFQFFCMCLKSQNIDHTIFRIEQVNDNIVGLLHSYFLQDLGYQNKTYNKVMSQYRQFITWLITEKGYSLKNPFVGIIRRKEAEDNTVITQSEMKALLGAIQPDNGTHVSRSGSKRNFYRDWLKTAIILALETGLRREEFMTLKFSDIQIDEKGNPFCIRVENFKVNRIKGLHEDRDKDIKTIPITEGLRTILHDLDFKGQQGSERYLIAPNEKATRAALGELVSKAFTHFWKCTKIERNVNLKHLRKTYLTALVNYFGDKATIISDHADIEILKKHYTNNEVIMKANQGFRVFE